MALQSQVGFASIEKAEESAFELRTENEGAELIDMLLSQEVQEVYEELELVNE